MESTGPPRLLGLIDAEFFFLLIQFVNAEMKQTFEQKMNTQRNGRHGGAYIHCPRDS